jgi:MFS family permease
LNSLPPSHVSDPKIERRNGNLFILTQLLTYFSAPVLYVGVVQAAFCDRLGASATVANLPNSTYLLGAIVPIFCAWLFPARSEQRIVQVGYTVVATSLLLVCAVVFLPAPNALRIGVVIGQGLLLGVMNSTISIYLMKCLARGTSEQGRARALKYAFGFGPVAAVLGSLFAQLLLAGKIEGVRYPVNFGILYLVALPCMAACALAVRRFRLVDVPDETTPSLVDFMRRSLGAFVEDRRLVITWISYLLWYCALGGMTNLSLYTREAVGRTPLELAGVIMALRFGCKSIAGFGIGSVAARFGARYAMICTVVFVGLGMAWPLISTGYGYLGAFGLMGAGELGGIFFINYVVSISQPALATRNLALLSLVAPVSSFVPALHGSLTDAFGFHASFLFGSLAAGAALTLLLVSGRGTPAKVAS